MLNRAKAAVVESTPWFAWRPVKLRNGRWAWLRTVKRNTHADFTGPQSRWEVTYSYDEPDGGSDVHRSDMVVVCLVMLAAFVLCGIGFVGEFRDWVRDRLWPGRALALLQPQTNGRR